MGATNRRSSGTGLSRPAVALCPGVSFHRSAPITYHSLLSRAEEEKNAEAVGELRAVGQPPYQDLELGIKTQAKWVAAFGHWVFGGPETRKTLVSRFKSIAGYDGTDYQLARRGQEFTRRLFFDRCLAVDLFERVPELQTAVAVGVGRHDLTNCSEVAVDWMKHVRAPGKRLHWFEQSAHFRHFSEPDRFQTILLETIGRNRN